MKDTQKCFVCGQDKFTHCILFPLWQYLHLRDSLPLLLKTFEWFCFVKFFSNTVYKGEVLLKSRWVILGLRFGPQESFFQKTTHKGNDSRNLEYNPEVGREVYFFTWAIFIKNNFLPLHFKSISWCVFHSVLKGILLIFVDFVAL